MQCHNDDFLLYYSSYGIKEMNKLYFLSIDETIDKTSFYKLFLHISKERQEYIKHLTSDIDKKLSLFAELMIRMIAMEHLEISNSKILFSKSQYGKPFIKGHAEFQFNISHTKCGIIVMISDKTVGADIEKIKPAEIKIANRFFTNYEQDYIIECSNKLNECFFEIWTKKEAYVKYAGKGFSISLRSFDVFDEMISRKLQTFNIDGYIVSICAESINEECEIVRLKEEQLKNIFYKMV